MFFGIAPLGICGRAVSALSRLSSALTSLPLEVARQPHQRRPQLADRQLALALADHVVVQRRRSR